MKKFLPFSLFAIIILLLHVSIYAAVPAGYYKNLNGKTTSDLKTALYNIIKNQSQQQTYSKLPTYFQRTDVYPNSKRWWDMYSDIPLYAPSFSGLNREHSLPKSWWGGSSSVLAYTDINHLYPSEMNANMAKSNYPLGVVTDGGSKFNNGVCMVGKGQNSGGAAYVFEPADEYKGDFARTYFYMVTCYQNFSWKYTYMCANGTYPSMQQWAIDLLLKWHRDDPVSQKEQNRNEQVYLIQANRNPYIDYPDLVEYIWGNKKGQAYNGSTTPVIPPSTGTLITPPNGMYLDFNQVAVNHTTTTSLQLRGDNLSGQVEIYFSGPNGSLFKFANGQTDMLIDASKINATNGTWININYTPNAIGSHTATLVLQDGGLPGGSQKVILRGEALAVPTLSAPTATAATDITADSYMAHWDEVPGETVDYYMVTLKRYKNGIVTTEEIPAEQNYLEIDGFNESDQDTYSVQSVRLEVRSPQSNTITVNPTAAIDNILDDKPLLVESFDGFMRFRCSEPQSDCVIYDISGRTVMIIHEISDQMEITLPQGIYFITTAQHRKPIKTVAR